MIFWPGTGLCLLFAFNDKQPNTKRHGIADREIDKRTHTLADNGIGVPGMATNNATKRDVAVEIACVQSHGYSRWQFQGTRHPDCLMCCSRCIESGNGAPVQLIGEIGKFPGFDDEEVITVGRAGLDLKTGCVRIHMRKGLCWSGLYRHNGPADH